MPIIIVFACFFATPNTAFGTSYYVDFTVGIANGDGLATTTSFNNLDSFTEVARSAGDIAFVRRNTASTTNVSDLNFTSDGTIANPIIISADNDNLWNDASTTAQTYTVAVATSTFTASATITGIQAGDWFYVTGDCTQTYNSTSLNQCDFFYEVAWVSGTQLGLFIPYKGNQTGAGNSLVNLGKNPQWNVTNGVFNWNFATDAYWLVKGIRINSTEVPAVIMNNATTLSFYDMILESDGSTSSGFEFQGSFRSVANIYKTRLFKYNSTMLSVANGSGAGGIYTVYDSLFDADGSGGELTSDGTAETSHLEIYMYDSFVRNSSPDIGTISVLNRYFFRNTALKSSTEIGSNTTVNRNLYFEDYDGTVGDNRFYSVGAGTNINTSLLFSTSTLRAGGGPTAIEVRPTTNTTSIWDFNKIKLFEYPIYTNTSSKQYDVYFRVGTSTTEWTTDPLVTELWIQCEYWAHDTNATSTRKIKKSTGVLDFNGSANWQNLSVTCQPSQTGILYLSGWYAKTKEDGQSNIFLVDNTPIIQ